MTISKYPVARVGVIGGGQLARMLVPPSRRLGIHLTVLDPNRYAPAAVGPDRFIAGGLYERVALEELCRDVEYVTFEIEHTDTRILREIERAGRVFRPAVEVLQTIQDKHRQKTVLSEKGIPVPRFSAPIGADDDPKETCDCFSLPCVQKARYGGYDGRGVLIVREDTDPEEYLSGETFFEEMISLEKELAVLVARTADGSEAVYPVFEMTFDPDSNICTEVSAPAKISESVARDAQRVAIEAARACSIVGICAVELFLTRNGEILVNEIAPRPHNSGHLTIEGCVTDQYEQHLRAVCGLPLGATDLITPTVMMNVLGDPDGSTGPVVLEGLTEALSIAGVSVHLYGKNVCRPYRKMGHLTARGKTLEQARERVSAAASVFLVRGVSDDADKAKGKTHG
jgi:5-(carboxyamino)imidazole ribonucleotide synthase